MKKLKSFEKLFWKKASERIEKEEKFLEGMGRRRRPFITRYEDKECRYFTVFLTTKPYSGIFERKRLMLWT